ncbi:MAG: LCCL domain-containing protein [Sphingomicrobium sp.]
MVRRLVLAIAALTLTGASVAIGVIAPATAQPWSDARSLGCPALLDKNVPSLECNCSAESVSKGGVWGSDVYTDDSAICRAALHAGVVGVHGGIVRVFESSGLPGYEAATRHGVGSNSWGVYSRSIMFRMPYPMNGMVAPSMAQSIVEGRILGCPSVLDTNVPSLVCNCSAEAVASGGVWGSRVYTDDSSICRSARHAGMIGVQGGIVDVYESPGLPGYEAATRHGVHSNSWGVYRRSIEFRVPNQIR